MALNAHVNRLCGRSRKIIVKNIEGGLTALLAREEEAMRLLVRYGGIVLIFLLFLFATQTMRSSFELIPTLSARGEITYAEFGSLIVYFTILWCAAWAALSLPDFDIMLRKRKRRRKTKGSPKEWKTPKEQEPDRIIDVVAPSDVEKKNSNDSAS